MKAFARRLLLTLALVLSLPVTLPLFALSGAAMLLLSTWRLVIDLWTQEASR